MARVWHQDRRLLQEHLRTLFNFFFAGLLGRVASSQAAPNASVVVTFGMVRRLLRAVFLQRLVQVLYDHGFGR